MKILKVLTVIILVMVSTSAYAGQGIFGIVCTRYEGAFYLVSNANVEVYQGNKLVASTKTRLCGDYQVEIPYISFEKYRVIVKRGTYMTRTIKPSGECGYDGFLGKFTGGGIEVNLLPNRYTMVDVYTD